MMSWAILLAHGETVIYSYSKLFAVQTVVYIDEVWRLDLVNQNILILQVSVSRESIA